MVYDGQEITGGGSDGTWIFQQHTVNRKSDQLCSQSLQLVLSNRVSFCSLRVFFL